MCRACWPDPHCRSIVDAGDVLGQTRCQRSIARDIERLLADLRDTAEHNIVDELRVDTGPANRLIDDERRQIHGMDVAQCTTVRLADTHGGAHGADDDCISVGHDVLQGSGRYGLADREKLGG